MTETITRRFAADGLKDDIRGRIEDGTLTPGDPIAGISQLAEQYEIAYGTARNAIHDLVTEGVLTSQWGKGTFVAPGNLTSTVQKDQFVALAYPLKGRSEILHRIQKDVMHRGGMLTLHSAQEDNQHPELERKFLQKVRQSGFKGVGLFATPVPPLNVDLYGALRSEGIKVALLSPPQYDVTQETVFLSNHRRGGYLAMKELSRRGYRNFVFVGSRDLAVYKDWTVEGMRRAELEVEGRVREVRSEICLNQDHPAIEGEAIDDWIRAHEAETAILVGSPKHAATLEAARQRAGSEVEDKLCVVSCYPDPSPPCKHLPRIDYDIGGILRDTVNYLMDDGVRADLLVQNWAQPWFVPGYLNDGSG
jgi:DNA-binding LacI/PurR family transcriptional regulator